MGVITFIQFEQATGYIGRHHGTHKIEGIAKREGVPSRLRVILFLRETMRPIKDTWSDSVTGAFKFEYLSPDEKYMIMTYSLDRSVNASIIDHPVLTPME